MADRDWQRGVLRDIGASGAGLVTFDSAQQVMAPPAPAVHQPVRSQWYDSASGEQVPLSTPGPVADPTATMVDLRQPTTTFNVPPNMFGNATEQERAAGPPAPETTAVRPPRTAESAVPLSAQVSTARPEAIAPVPSVSAPPPERVSAPLAAPVQAPAAPVWAPEPAIHAPVPPAPAPVPQPEPTPQPTIPQQFPETPEAGAFSAEAPPSVRGEPMPGDALIRKNPYGDPFMRRMGLGVRKAVGTSAANDLRELADFHTRLTRPVSTCRQIAVVSVRGGAGKTTLAALIATTIAEHREDRILVVDADTGFGSLPLRLGAATQKSMYDLASVHPRSWEEASSYLTQVAQRLWVLSATSGGGLGRELDLDTFRSAFGGLGRYFSTSVIDCGAGILGGLQQGILATAHAQVLVTPATVDGAFSARNAVEWFTANGRHGLLPRTVIALVTHTPHDDADLEQVQAMLSAGGMTVIPVPYDRHLATGTSIDPNRIGAATRTAAIQIAADVFARSSGGVG